MNFPGISQKWDRGRDIQKPLVLSGEKAATDLQYGNTRAELVGCLVINRQGKKMAPLLNFKDKIQGRNRRKEQATSRIFPVKGTHPQCLERPWAMRARRVDKAKEDCGLPRRLPCPPSALTPGRARLEPGAPGKPQQHSEEVGCHLREVGVSSMPTVPA